MPAMDIIALATLALAFQPSAYMSRPDFMPAYTRWIECTHRVMDGEDFAGQSDDEIVAAAYAGCTAEEGAVRAVIVAASGAARGARDMDEFRTADRQALLDRAQRERAALARRPLEAAAGVLAQCQKDSIDAGLAGSAEERVLIETAFAACAAQEAAARDAALALLGDARQADHLASEIRDTARTQMRRYIRAQRHR
jgi:hypothetical protein